LEFPVESFRRHCLLEGLDEIGLTLRHAEKISRYEAAHPA
jgi:3-isopropylmalate/(R)-2-methylmalate dehydratase small subunit